MWIIEENVLRMKTDIQSVIVSAGDSVEIVSVTDTDTSI